MSATPKTKTRYTTAQVEKLISHNTFLTNELRKIRLPKEMTVSEYNDVVKFLRTIKEGFENSEPAPELLPEPCKIQEGEFSTECKAHDDLKVQDHASDSHI